MQESERQKKIGVMLQEDLAEILQEDLRKNNVKNLLLSVTSVKVTKDLTQARVLLSIFPADNAGDIIEEVRDKAHAIKHQVAQRVKQQLRRMPDLHFYYDNSQEYKAQIDHELKEGDNPIRDRDLLPKRKKS